MARDELRSQHEKSFSGRKNGWIDKLRERGEI